MMFFRRHAPRMSSVCRQRPTKPTRSRFQQPFLSIWFLKARPLYNCCISTVKLCGTWTLQFFNWSQVEKLKGKSLIVLVRPSAKVSSWIDVDPSLANDLSFSQYLSTTTLTTTTTATTPATTTSVLVIRASDDNVLQDSVCEVGLDLQDCKANEECVQVIVS